MSKAKQVFFLKQSFLEFWPYKSKASNHRPQKLCLQPLDIQISRWRQRFFSGYKSQDLKDKRMINDSQTLHVIKTWNLLNLLKLWDKKTNQKKVYSEPSNSTSGFSALHSTTAGRTFRKWALYLLHFSGVMESQMCWIQSTGSSLVEGSITFWNFQKPILQNYCGIITSHFNSHCIL